MAEINDLPGRPTKRRVKDVRAVLWLYLRSSPRVSDECWRLAWAWAAKQADDSLLWQFGKRRRPRWPSATEIASRYLLLCLTRMQGSCALRVGVGAEKSMPESVLRFVDRETEALRLLDKRPRPLLAIGEVAR